MVRPLHYEFRLEKQKMLKKVVLKTVKARSKTVLSRSGRDRDPTISSSTFSMSSSVIRHNAPWNIFVRCLLHDDLAWL